VIGDTVTQRAPMRSAMMLAAACAIVFLWASVYSAIHIALADFSSGQLAFLRLAIGSTVLAGWGAVTGTPLPDRRYWLRLAVIGLIGFAAYLVLLNLGQRSVEAATASFIINTTPALSALLAAVFLGDKLRLAGIAGIAISLGGVGLIAFSGGGALRFDHSLGALILLGAAIVHAMHFVYQKATLAEVSPFAVTAGSMIAGALCLAPFAPGTYAAVLRASPQSLIVVLYLGVLCSAFAHLAWSHLLAHLSATRATSILMLNSPMAALIGALWLGEVIPAAVWCGGLLTIGGVALVQLYGAQVARRQRR